MPDLKFQVESVVALPFAAAPTLAFAIRISNSAQDEAIHSVALQCRLQIEARRREYNDKERAALLDLFGQPARWGQTLRPMLWTEVGTVVPAFSETVLLELQTPCTFDFNVAATKYFHGLQDGDVPVSFLFSGTVCYASATGLLQVAPIPWDKEARFRLPVKVWREMMDVYYPGSAWLCLRRDTFERLHRYKREHGIPTWDEALDRILTAIGERAGAVNCTEAVSRNGER